MLTSLQIAARFMGGWLVSVCIASSCLAWGEDGHRIVGALAAERLTPEARRRRHRTVGKR
uniref:Putative S1/P1 nuclease n=1 Tax=uncultured bacterium CBNPD1 BAC clone 543 TaxID=417308 RepID=B1N6H8_9BACT|nr:putative S1/P1 nuclease [uncultured bacterium CBNPD1 BAC clone 543]